MKSLRLRLLLSFIVVLHYQCTALITNRNSILSSTSKYVEGPKIGNSYRRFQLYEKKKKAASNSGGKGFGKKTDIPPGNINVDNLSVATGTAMTPESVISSGASDFQIEESSDESLSSNISLDNRSLNDILKTPFGNVREKSASASSNNVLKNPPENSSELKALTDDAIRKSSQYQKARQEKIEALQSKISLLKSEEDLVATDSSVGAVPEIVANRMIKRIAAFFGIPVFGGLLIFVGAFFSFKKYDIVVPPMYIAYMTQFPFVVGLLGITYGILSSSWDDTDGSLLGFSEAKTNLQRIKDGLSRSKQAAKLRAEIEDETKDIERSSRF